MGRILSILVIVIAVTSCTTTSPGRTVAPPPPPPPREADLYPNARSIAGLTIAVDAISDPDRLRRYFGADLAGEGILPVNVIFSNHGEDRFLVRPADVLLFEGNDPAEQVPVEIVEKSLKAGLQPNLVMQEKIVAAKDTYSSFLFFRIRKGAVAYGTRERFYSDRLTLRIVAMDQENGERIRFGPYMLSE